MPKSVQLLKVGNFYQENGKQVAITKDMLRSFKKNFDAKARGYEDGKLPVDYFHENDKVAGGWMSGIELQNDDSELWAEVEWTPKAAQMLADGELRYISAEFNFNYRHNEGGKTFGPTLFGAGLTNRPFIKGMQAVVNLSEGEAPMTLEEAMAKIKELQAQIDEMKKAAADDQAADDAGTELSAVKKELADIKAKYTEEKKMAEKKDQFNKMLSEGKACEAQREAFVSGDMMKFAENAKPLNTSAKGSENGGKDENAGDDTAIAQVEKLAEKLRADRKIGYRESISMALSENKELSKKYEKETSIA